MNRFVHHKVAKAEHYSLGVDTRTGSHYISIPVGNRLVDYEEYYRLDEMTYQAFIADANAAARFAEECRRRKHDRQLIMPPGTDRGTAI